MTSKTVKPAKRGRKARVSVPRRLTPVGVPLRVGKQCIATARSGEPCKSPPLRGKKKCRFHLYPAEAALMGAKGGRRRAIFNPANLEPFAAPKTAGDLLRLLAQTIVEVRSGRLDPKVANSIAYLAGGLANTLELVEYGARLDALESKPAAEEKRPDRGPSVTAALPRFVGAN
jgi:hypothetical protein